MAIISPLPKYSFEEISQKLSNVDDLPTLPNIIDRIIKATEYERTGSKELMQIIANDQSLSAKLLKVANSAFYGLRFKVTTVDAAISTIGFNDVKKMAISAYAAKSFPTNVKTANFVLEKFWIHSIGVANIASIIAEKLGKSDTYQNDIFTGGLLHDIGKLIICQYFPKHFFLIILYTQTLNKEMLEIDETILGLHHGYVGNILSSFWELPIMFSKIICHHHLDKHIFGTQSETDFYLSIINIADTMARRMGIGASGNLRIPQYREDLLEILQIDNFFLEEISNYINEIKFQFDLLV